jgi:hypothetical protein
MDVTVKRRPDISDARISKKSQIYQHNWNAHGCELPAVRDAIRELVVRIARDRNSRNAAGQGDACLLDGLPDAVVVLAGVGRVVGPDRLSPRIEFTLMSLGFYQNKAGLTVEFTRNDEVPVRRVGPRTVDEPPRGEVLPAGGPRQKLRPTVL